MKLVVIESPCAGDTQCTAEEYAVYARACLTDSLYRGEAPIASHLLHTQVLDDADPTQREMGISAGTAWIRRADLVAVYDDWGISLGMQRGIDRARACGVRIEYRQLLKG